MFAPFTSSLRYTLPRVEQRLKDRRSGAYPTKARTGDRTRSGRNKYFFDDTRTVIFQDNATVSLPTTMRSGTLASDLASDFHVNGNVIPRAVDQWIPHRAQVERPGPFIEDKLFEQDHVAVVNSSFMTGAAYSVAPDRFKSSVANKTIIRIEIPLSKVTRLSALTSSIHYLNPVSGGFDLVATENARIPWVGGRLPQGLPALPFTPYGSHYLPIKETSPFAVSRAALYAERGYRMIPGYVGDGNDAFFYEATEGTGFVLPVTASVLNPRHRANISQSVDLAQYIGQPFLLEKAVVEFPFEAGPGWLNDRFGYRLGHPNANVVDFGGPLITVALMRQDNNTNAYRDIIASGTFTNALDVQTGSYSVMTQSSAGFTSIAATPEGVGSFYTPTFVVRGTSSPSGSNNYYTGSIKLEMNPAVSSHVFRLRVSGSGRGYFAPISSTFDNGPPRTDESIGLLYGPTTKRTGRNFQTSRNVLGNHLALLPLSALSGITNPIRGFDTQYENLKQDPVLQIGRMKIYNDLVAKTKESPYLLYPGDKLILAINKHRAVGPVTSSLWTLSDSNFNNNTVYGPLTTVSSHDAKVPRGMLRLTLYGDLLKEDREFHDTLNQRLETEEIWENIGEDPVLDQFDVTYASELSSSYLDRCNIFTQVSYMQDELPVSTGVATYGGTLFDFARDVGHFADGVAVDKGTWQTLGYNTQTWAAGRFAWELRKSNRNSVLTSDELFWDTRLPRPADVMLSCNSLYCLTNDSATCLESRAAYSGNVSDMHGGPTIGTSGNGINDWYMSYPYEKRYAGLDYTFYNNLVKDIFTQATPGAHGAPLIRILLDYNAMSLEIGSLSGSSDRLSSRFLASDGAIALQVTGVGYGPLRKPEFIKFFFGIGDGISEIDNQHVRPYTLGSPTAMIRGWRYGMLNAFPTYTTSVFRRDRFGQFRDMLEQRVDGKFYNSNVQNNIAAGVKDSPVQVKFYDQKGASTSAVRTLSSNLSTEATSSLPYTDGVARNRSVITYDNMNISRVII